MTEYVTQNIRTVLKTFQSSAPKSLQGPGHALQAAAGPLDVSHSGGSGGGDAVGNTHQLSPCGVAVDHCHQAGSAPPTVPPPVALIKKEIFSSPEPFELGNENASITIVPPPPPELPQPILSAADSGSGELYETRLEGKTIGCYSLGGEMRLCLPQFLNNVLADFTLDQINRIFDELGIFCSQCTPDQLMEFKAAKILPSDVKACGLITRTDAERLCAALLHRADRNIYINDADIPKGAISFKVYHRCFGKCEGICTPDMYSYTKPTCIMCLECKGYFSPQKFVGHVHRKQENRTCHWGFDSRNWHEYLHVALDVENREKYQKILDELKEVEFKEAMKAQRDLSYLKRKAEMFPDDTILGPPSLGHSPSAISLPPHQQLIAANTNCGGKQQRELLDIPSKKLKNIDEASAYQLSEYQRYQALFYAQCMQQQRIGQMSAFRPWAPPKSFLQVPYNAVTANLPYLSQEPPVLQNPERVVRNSDRERFERTYQPNVALAPRKSILTKEREKEQRERDQRDRERVEREQRERELMRVREREMERERSLEREREREQRERELQQKKLQQQQQQQQQHVAITNLCEAELVHIKQERANTPIEMPPSPPAADEELLLERHSNGAMEDETTMPMMSPLSLSRNQHHLPQQQQQQQHQSQSQQQQQQKSNNIELLQRRHSLHTSNSTSSTSSTSSTLSTHSMAGVCNDHEQLLLSSTSSPQQQHQLSSHLPPPSHQHHHHQQHRLSQQQQQLLPLPQHQHSHLQQLRSQQQQHPPTPPSPPPAATPEEFSGSNEISSSTSPLPPIQHNQQQQLSGGSSALNNNIHQQLPPPHQAQTIIATVNQHAKLLPNSSCAASAIITANNSNCNSNNNEIPSRIRISKNLINQPNIMRSPTPPSPNQQQHHHHHQHQQLIQHQQQYEQYKQQQRYYQQQQQQTQRLQNPPQQQQSPSQSSSANSNLSSNFLSQEARVAAGLNLSSNGGASVLVSKHQHLHQQQNGGTHMGSEFELSTDTDDDSLNGEPDSSNMLAPWELAVEALKDARPKDRERILQLLQKLLQDNQQYRFDNLQLSEELRKRDKQICDLQEQLYRCHQQQQQQQHQIQHQQHQLHQPTNQNGENGFVARNEDPTEGMLRLPLKKSTRRDPVAAAEAISVVVLKRKQQLQSCNGLNNMEEENERSNQRERAVESESELDEEDEEEKGAKTTATVKSEHGHQNASDNEETDVGNNDDDDVDDDEEAEERPTTDKEQQRVNVNVERNSLHSQQQRKHQPNCRDEEDEEDEEDDNNSRMSETDSDDGNEIVKAPHTNAVATPPTATTPISPDSAATAGRLFDSSNSSDDESMKQAQMSASNALAKMAADRQEAEHEHDEEDDEVEEEEDVENERDQDESDRKKQKNIDRHDNHDDDVDEGDEDDQNEEVNERDDMGRRRATVTNSQTTTTTTNNEIKIKQEII